MTVPGTSVRSCSFINSFTGTRRQSAWCKSVYGNLNRDQYGAGRSALLYRVSGLSETILLLEETSRERPAEI